MIPEDFKTHKQAWRLAIESAMLRATTLDDRAYWKHELDAYDRAHIELADLESGRCVKCKYQHGHAIGCQNNPVDISLRNMEKVFVGVTGVVQETVPEDWETLMPFGFAPGDYLNTCIGCKKTFVGDKRARRCVACATSERKKL